MTAGRAMAKGDIVFQIDADEIPHEYLIEILGEVPESVRLDIILSINLTPTGLILIFSLIT